MPVYLDYNATTPLSAVASDALLPWLGRPANPMSLHRWGRAAAMAIDHARAQVAEAMNWHREGVLFTSGATEANATVLSTGRWAVSAIEHPSVAVHGALFLPANAQGICLPEHAPDLSGMDGVSIMLANNETGVVQPISEWSAFCRARGLRLHVDAAQGPGKVSCKTDADFMTISAHKFGGPQGVGALLYRQAPPILLAGGPQERSRRAGTHNVAGIVGMGAAAAAITLQQPELRDRLESALIAQGGRVAGAGAERLPNTLCIGFDGIDAQDLVIALDLAGIGISAGSACSSGSPKPSTVLKAMQFPGSAVRFSLGQGTTAAEIDETIQATTRILGQLRYID